MQYTFSKEILFSAVLIGAMSVIARTEKDCQEISPSIVNDLRDFTELIDKVEFGSIVAEHILIDKGFRKAFKYLKTKDFRNSMEELQNVSEIHNILDYLKILVPCSKTDIFDELQLEIVLLDAVLHETEIPHYRYHRERRSSENFTTFVTNVSTLTTFTSFVQEVLKILPRSRYVSLIKKKCEMRAEFKTFYAAIRSSTFKPKLEEAIKSKNVQPYLEKLTLHAIDVKSLLPVLFELLSWGPDIY